MTTAGAPTFICARRKALITASYYPAKTAMSTSQTAVQLIVVTTLVVLSSIQGARTKRLKSSLQLPRDAKDAKGAGLNAFGFETESVDRVAASIAAFAEFQDGIVV